MSQTETKPEAELETGLLRIRQQGEGKDLVLLHGWGLNSGVFDLLLHELVEHYRVTLVDLPGYGINNDILPETYDLASVAHMVEQVLPHQCILLGWSLGGLVAQRVALDFPDRIQKLILVASSPKFAAEDAAEDKDQWPGILPHILETFKNQLQSTYSKTLDRFMAIQAMGSKSARSDIATIRDAVSVYPEPHHHALEKGLDILQNIDLRAELAGLGIPTVRMYGKLDSLVPKKAIENISTHHPGSHSVVFAKASHAPFISHPEEFIQELFNHL